MKRFLVIIAGMAAALAMTAPPASSYGGGATHDTWQVGMSFNCTNPDFCGADLGGFWGWAEFDRSADGATTWGDLEGAGCGHSVGGGGFAGAVHVSIEIQSWTIEPGSAGSQTFFASGEETDSFRGHKETSEVTHADTGIPAVPGHYSTDEVLGFDAPPGVAIQIQVSYRPAK